MIYSRSDMSKPHIIVHLFFGILQVVFTYTPLLISAHSFIEGDLYSERYKEF